MRPSNIVLIGPSGSGKSELAARLADSLGFRTADTDELITARVGMTIAEFFARFGEPAFRAVERETIAQLFTEDGLVVATGGGAVLAPENWLAWRPRSLVIGLTATSGTLAARVLAQQDALGSTAARPLMAGDAVARIAALLRERTHLYAQADLTIDTESLSPEEVAARVLENFANGHAVVPIPQLCIGSPTGRSDIYIGDGLAGHAPSVVHRRWPNATRVWVVSDTNVAKHWLDETVLRFCEAGYETRAVVVPAGEASKSMAEVTRLCDAMTTGGVTRRDVVVALGGGVVGDLAGFVASVCLRGLPLVQLPTSLLAMVDSSVGGKTGVDTPGGKNMVGAFYQPGVVIVDPGFLSTLPVEEMRSGMGEVIKHALIQPSTPLGGDTLLACLSRVESLVPLPTASIVDVLSLNIAIKHSVVQADERESGLRMILNFGHTAGHAIEADGYRYRHGEAIGLGMRVVANMARAMGRVDADYLARLDQLLTSAGLPTTIEANADTIVANLSRDKKNVDGAVHWVLPTATGGVEIVSGVSPDTVREALRACGAT